MLLSYVSSFQAIIRGLKESGIFTAAVTSAKANLKVKSSNIGLENKESIHTNVTAARSTMLKEGGDDNSQATARKILEMIDIHEEAMPPMSPPGFLELIESSSL
jgi:ribosome biogenesis GTPase A